VRFTFEYDPEKARTNWVKHRVSFEEAASVFYDPEHSDDEDRYISVGRSRHDRLLVVCYVERGTSIRLISARAASQNERRNYEENV
jgi:uncharacterized protein